MKTKNKSNILISILALVSVVVLFFLIRLETNQVENKTDLEKEIESLQNQKEELISANKQLLGRISYINTQEYKEEVVRTQVGMKRDGELVYSFPKQTEPEVVEVVKEIKPTRFGNALSWLHYFFPVMQ
jgi:cell division protein FtsB